MSFASRTLTPSFGVDFRPPWGVARRRLARLRAMSPREMAYRGAQAASTWLERVRSRPAAPDPAAVLARTAPALARAESARHMLTADAPRRFFAGVADPVTAELIRRRMPEAYRELLSAADRLRAREFDLLGYKRLSFGDPVDWQLDPVWQRPPSPRRRFGATSSADLLHWSRIDPLDPARVGDSKIVWELNRHQWVTQLAHAAVLGDDERYAESALSALDDWLRENPPSFGINWTSSLEVAYRLVSWCWTLALLRDSAALTDERLARYLAGVWHHATYVQKHLSHYFSPNTHLTGEAIGLFYAGTLFREFRDAARWRDAGARILLAQLDAQTSPDGVHFEQSACYQRYTVDTYLQFVLLADRARIAVPPAARARLTRMAEFLMTIQRPDGRLPSIGDGDGGDALPLMPHKPHDVRATLGLAAAVLDRHDMAARAGELTPEVAWLAGPTVASALHVSRGPRRSRVASACIGGYAISQVNSHQLIVDAAPFGCPHSGGHGHADLLSVQCSIFGDPCLVDAGTGCYTAEPEWRNFFRGTSAHSTVMVDGRGQAEPATAFSWTSRPDASLNMWYSDRHIDYADGWHGAYRGDGGTIVHRRRVVFVKPHYWAIVDDLSAAAAGARRHQVEVQFQFAPIDVDVAPDHHARARTARGHVLHLMPFATSAIAGHIHCGRVSPPRGWTSDDYGCRTPSPMLVYAAEAELPWRMLTLLFPARRASTPVPVPRPVVDADGRPCGLRFEEPLPSVTVSNQRLVVGATVIPVRGFTAAV